MSAQTSRAWTVMGNHPECSHCGHQVHATGMIGGGWRVDGHGGPELVLEVQTHPGRHGIENARVRIMVDREGRVVEVSTF